MTLTETLASFAADVQYQNLPPPVTSSIRKRLLDLSGVALAACPLPTTQMIIRLASGWGGAEEATVIGMNQRFLPWGPPL